MNSSDNAASSSPASPSPKTGRKPARKTRRLRVDDVLVVKRSRIRTAISGTVVGNFMEWFDMGIYGYTSDQMHAYARAAIAAQQESRND